MFGSLVMLAMAPASISGDLSSAIAAAHSDRIARESDKFAGGSVNESMAGRAFHVVLPIGDGTMLGNDPPNSGFYAYDPDKGELELTFSTGTVRTTGKGDDGLETVLYYPTFDLRRRTLPGRAYVGQNAFGVAARVSVMREEADAIALLDGPDIADARLASHKSYSISLPLSGPEARRVALDTVVEIDGELALLDNQKLTRCASDYSGPTIDRPTETTRWTCFAGAKINRIAFVRLGTKAVIREWLLDNAPASGPELWHGVRYGMTRKQFLKVFPETDWPKFAYSIIVGSEPEIGVAKISNGIVTSVERKLDGQDVAASRTGLMALYGSPSEDRCPYIDTVCDTRWLTADGVRIKFYSIGKSYITVNYTVEVRQAR